MQTQLGELLDIGQKGQARRESAEDWHTLYFSDRFDFQALKSWLIHAGCLRSLYLRAYDCIVLGDLLKPL